MDASTSIIATKLKTTFHYCILALFLSCQPSIAPKEVSDYNKKLLEIVKTYSIYSDSLDWPEIEMEIKEFSRDFKSVKQCSQTVKFIIDKLQSAGDNHTLYIPKSFANTMSIYKKDTVQPEAHYFSNNNIAYIKVPGIMTMNDSLRYDFANRIQLFIKSMDSNLIKGWIVDLRENTGGDMYAMIAGLGPLTGEGILGNFIDKNGTKTSWSYKNGTALSDTSILACVPNPYIINNKNARIAVLINKGTGSSGEMTAISFIGKPNTKLFGQATGGYTTGNSTFKLPDSAYIALATSIAADRNMKLYGYQINPDVWVHDLESYNIKIDQCITLATKWLLE